MRPSCLAYRTDLMFHRFDGQVADAGDHLVVSFPDNPGYYFGNFLLFPRAPEAGDAARWEQLFHRELSHRPGIRHVALCWDGGEIGASHELRDRGYELMDDMVLSTDRPAPDRSTPDDVVIAPVERHDDWDQVAELQQICDPLIGESEAYARFRARNRARLRAMAELGHGRWLGAFSGGGELLAQMGIFADGELARFRDVETHPDHRRRGIASAMVARAIATGLGELGARTVVVVADGDSDGERVYRAAGFSRVGVQRAALRQPQTG